MKQTAFIFLFLLSIVFSNAQTFSGGGGTTIPDGGSSTTCYAPITVSGVGIINGTYGLSSACINVKHTWDGDLLIQLKAPDGTTVNLSNQNGSSGTNYTGTCFNMSAGTAISAGTAPFTGSFIPDGSLGAMNNGQNANGQWYICIQDYTGGDTGHLVNWSLTFNNSPAQPPPPMPSCVANPPAGNTCTVSTPVCSFSGYCGNTDPATYSADYWTNLYNAFCGSIECNSFVTFVASATTVSYNVWVYNSTFGDGIQMFIYDGACPVGGANPTVNALGCVSEIYPTGSGAGAAPYNFTVSGLTVGKTYYLMFDGYAGDKCDYTIDIAGGVSTGLVVTATPSTICLGQNSILSASGVPGGTYSWAGPAPTAYLSSTSGATVTVTPTATGTFTYNVTVTGSSVCPKTIPVTLTVSANATISLSSAAGTNIQTRCTGTAITNITYAVGAATGATVTGLPAGVTGSYSAGVFTITGTPTATGVFNYTVTTTGPCTNVSATGTLTVNPGATITLTSAAGTNNQIVCINTAITAIKYTVAGSGTGATVSGLPSGITGAYSAGVFTISGTPTASGTFNYTVSTTGPCTAVTATGTITVTAIGTITLSSAAGTNNQTKCVNAAITNITYTIVGATGATVSGLPAGVTGSYSAGVFTISGTPTVTGTFNYTVSLTGTCGSATATGTLTITPGATITLSSVAGTNNQTVCVSTAITAITYTMTLATGATVTGLPAGVTGAYSAGVFTISGTPTATGTFNFTVTTTGGCSNVSATGTIIVSVNSTVSLTSANPTKNQTKCINTAITNITYSIVGAMGGSVTGLPAGVTTSYVAGVLTISGTPTVSGTFNYTVTPTGGCGAANSTGTITVTPGATTTLTSAAGTDNQTVCLSTAITAITYSVTNGTGATVTGLPAGVTGSYAGGVFTISDTPTASGTFNYTVTPTTACPSTAVTGTLTVTASSVITLTSGAGTNVQAKCVNTAITTITYSITAGTGATVSGLPAGVTGLYSAGVYTISGTPTATGTFNYTVTVTGGCGVVTATGTLTISPLATIILSSAAGTDNQSKCINTAITNITYILVGATGASVTGLPAGVTGLYAAGVFTISGTPTVSGTFNYTVTPTGGCGSASATGTLTINPNATVTLTSAAGTNIQTVCVSTVITSITYSVVSATGATVTGLPAGVSGSYAAGVLTISGSPTATGTFNYTVTPTGGCGAASAAGILTVTANAIVTLTSAAGTNSQTNCINTAINNITYSLTGSTGATSSGLPAGVTGSYSAGVFTISGTPTASGTFNYTVTPTGGCGTASATGTLTINPDATIALTSAVGTNIQTVCVSTAITSITYNIGSATGATVSGLPAGVTGSYAAGVFTINGTPTAIGTFNYTVTPAGGCGAASATGTLTVTANATITLTSAAGTNNQIKCINNAITNISYSLAGATGASVTGLPAGVTGSYVAGAFTISGTPTVSGTFTYTVTPTGGCGTASATGTLTINPDATIALTSAAGTNIQTVCVSTAITSITYNVGSATGATVTGLPVGVTGSYAAGVFTISGTPTATGTFNYTVTPTGGCGSASATGTLTISANATVPLTSAAGTNNQVMCINTPVNTVTYSVTGATGATVTGLPAGVSGSYAAGVFTISGTPTASGTFNYTVTPTGGCGSATATGTITVNANATVTLSSAVATDGQQVCINNAISSITYAINGGTGATVTGLPAGVTGSYTGGVFTISGTPTASGAFNYTVTVTGGCGSNSATGIITVNANASILLTSAAGTNIQSICISTPIATITYDIGGSGTGAAVSGLPTGVSGSYSAGVFAITGTPTVTGVFNYTVTSTGLCSNVTATGTITVAPNANIALASAPGTNNQTLCVTTSLVSIAYNISGSGTGATVSGLPAGVSGSYAGGVFTISGSPTSVGTFNYTVTTTGTCGNVSAVGIITITGNATISLTSAPATSSQTICVNAPLAAITYNVGGSGTGASVTGLPIGVTGSYNSGVFTISGSPSVTGTFNYSVTTVGSCGNTSASGTITVRPNATISLSSAAGTNAQTLCIDNVLTPIKYTIGGSGTGAGVSGLPAGVMGSYAGGVFTISGTPTVAGTFNYSVNTIGSCGSATATGKITITPDATIALASAAGTNAQSICVNAVIDTIRYTIGSSGSGASVTGLPTGTTGTYSGGMYTVSGIPTVTGTFNYTVTTTGSCNNVTISGIISVKPNATITLSSAPGSNNQTKCINSTVGNITYTVSNATGATVTGLPAGITGTYNAGLFTISGTPSVSGTFNFTITTTGPCVNATATGTLIVNPNAIISLTSQPSSANQSVCTNSSIGAITYAISSGGTGVTVTGLPPGTTGVLNSGVFTITGTPSAAGTYTYSVTTSGLCSNSTATGTITVNSTGTILLTSVAGTNSQTTCVNSPIAVTTYAIGGSATGAIATGLPPGVTGSYNAGVFTISGMPSVSGVFNYAVSVTGGCGASSVAGILIATANAIVGLNTAIGTDKQTVCVNTSIAAISYVVSGGTGASVSGLPAGVTGTYNSGVFTISGTPATSGTFTYTVSQTGGCGNASVTGSITVTPNATIILTSPTGTNNQTACINTPVLDINYSVTTATGTLVTGLPAGVTGTYNSGIVSITGIPTVSGVFTYTVKPTGACGSASVTGFITITPNATISLISPASTANQVKCINTSVIPITYNIGASGTGASVTGLPPGVSGVYTGGIYTIGGIPTVSGIFNYTVTTSSPCGNVSAQGTLTVSPDATIALSSANGTNNQSLCVNTAITPVIYYVGGSGSGAVVSGLPAGVTGSYNGGAFTISGSPSVTGTFNYTITTTGTCKSASASGAIKITGNASIALSSATGSDHQALCVNKPLAPITYSITGGTGATVIGFPAGVTGSYSAGVFTISGTPTVSGPFNYTVTTTGSCGSSSAQGTILVTTGPSISAQPASTVACAPNSVYFSVQGLNIASYQWQVSNNNGTTWTNLSNTGVYSGANASVLNITNVTGLDKYMYRVVVTGISPCSSVITSNAATLNVNAPITITRQPKDIKVCSGVTTGFSVTTTGTGTKYKWQVNKGNGWTDVTNGNLYSGTTTPTLGVSDSKGLDGYMYRVQLSAAATCNPEVSNEVTLNVETFKFNLKASAGPVIILDNVTLTTSAPVPYTVLSWSPADIFTNQSAQSQTIKPMQSFTATVTAKSDDLGCEDTETVPVHVSSPADDVFVANAFTPNGDGKNDVLTVKGNKIKTLEMRIFNQWGQEVFATHNKDMGWNGMVGGKQQPEGVYVYVVKAFLISGEEITKKGSFTLIR